MDLSDKKAFLKLLAETLAAYGKEMTEGPILAAWWAELNSFPLPIVAQAFAEYKAENGEFAPAPAGIAKRCRSMDGRPGPEEAWAMLPVDGETSVVWCDEMAEAWGIALPLLQEGDRIAARMAFKEAYSRFLAQAREQHIAPRWTLSQGADKLGIQRAVSEAVRKRRISLDSGVALLSPEAAEGMLIALGVTQHPLLAAPSKKGQEEVRALLANLKIGKVGEK